MFFLCIIGILVGLYKFGPHINVFIGCVLPFIMLVAHSWYTGEPFFRFLCWFNVAKYDSKMDEWVKNFLDRDLEVTFENIPHINGTIYRVLCDGRVFWVANDWYSFGLTVLSHYIGFNSPDTETKYIFYYDSDGETRARIDLHFRLYLKCKKFIKQNSK